VAAEFRGALLLNGECSSASHGTVFAIADAPRLLSFRPDSGAVAVSESSVTHRISSASQRGQYPPMA
jgi:L-lactate utilization protein LutC